MTQEQVQEAIDKINARLNNDINIIERKQLEALLKMLEKVLSVGVQLEA